MNEPLIIINVCVKEGHDLEVYIAKFLNLDVFSAGHPIEKVSTIKEDVINQLNFEELNIGDWYSLYLQPSDKDVFVNERRQNWELTRVTNVTIIFDKNYSIPTK